MNSQIIYSRVYYLKEKQKPNNWKQSNFSDNQIFTS